MVTRLLTRLVSFNSKAFWKDLFLIFFIRVYISGIKIFGKEFNQQTTSNFNRLLRKPRRLLAKLACGWL